MIHIRLILILSLLLPPLSLDAQADDERFHPDQDVPACILWLDAFDLDGDGAPDPFPDGSPVEKWIDKSGRGHHATQTVDGNQPTLSLNAMGGRSVLRFHGNDSMVNPIGRDWSSESWTLFVVASLDHDASNNWRGIIGNRFGKGAPRWWTLGTKSDGTTYLELAAGKGVHTRLTPGNSGAYIYSVVKYGSRFVLHRNGVEAGTTSMANVGDSTNELRIGRWFSQGQEWDGDVAEIILYGRALEADQRVAVEKYLARKWEVLSIAGLYSRETTWARTMLASRKALLARFGERRLDRYSRGALSDLWQIIKNDFHDEAARMERDAAAVNRDHLDWLVEGSDVEFEKALIALGGATHWNTLKALERTTAPPDDPRWLELYAQAAAKRDAFLAWQKRLEQVNLPALRRAISDLTMSFPEEYPQGPSYLSRLNDIENRLPMIREGLTRCDDDALDGAEQLVNLQYEALLENPLLQFDELLVVRRSDKSPGLGLVNNWVSNCGLPRSGFDDEIAVLSPVRPGGALTTLYRPENPVFVGDVDLHFDADRVLFSSIGTNNCWQIFEVRIDGTALRQVTPGDQPDVDSYDACYLPDGRIVFTSNAYMVAVPCVNGSQRTAVLYSMNADGSGIRQLCFDQEHNWCPTMLPSGRILYLRWEYTDTPHSHDRVLFHMNPDGTGQMEYYGSNSYWPNSLFYAKPLPGRSTQFAGIVSGHHGVPRMGELVLFDIARGRREAAGAIQRIPGFGKPVASETDPRYESILIQDQLVDASWPKFLHPFPLSDKYFLVSCKPTPDALWGVYLVDVFDNMLLLREEPGYVLFEPVPVQKKPRPPVIPDRVDLARRDATVYMTDVHAGDGLKGIPRGTVKRLRLFTYHFLYPGMGGPQAVVGMEGPWDIKRIMGTVPVHEDGSAYFRVPANTPIAVQPLDGEGKAVQLMRSWFTAMPGEVLSCVGCHETQNSAPPAMQTFASGAVPSEIAPWYGPERGFNFEREVQPVLDKYCVRCHDGERDDLPNLKEREHITDYTSVFHSGDRDAGHFSLSYTELHRFVRRPGLESDYHLLMPMEFHAGTTQLVQLLEKGHQGVRLDAEAWDRLITWIDLNAPFHGTWHEIAGIERVEGPAARRRELLKMYAGMDADPELIPRTMGYDASPAEVQSGILAPSDRVICPDWPFDGAEARRRQEALIPESADRLVRTLDLGDGSTMELILVPAGEFVMGEMDKEPDERPQSRVRIEESFWMGRFEVTNAQFERFDPSHDSRVEHRFSMQFGVRGFYVNGPEQPVVRVSWKQAMSFCEWLSDKTGEAFTLPTEAEWEYACRAGTAKPLFYGDEDTDFSPFANLADEKLREFVCHTYKKVREPWLHASKYDDWIPKDTRFNDNGFLSDGVGNYLPNAWGLHDMHGNVAEWTRSIYRAYPHHPSDGRDDVTSDGDRVVRGGSWRDRPKRSRSAFRLAYRPYQGVYNVGFRVICTVDPLVVNPLRRPQ